MATYKFELPVTRTNPFTPKSLPLISELNKIGFHKYKNRWTKRFGKRLGRIIFDVGYHFFGLGGEGKALIHLPNNEVTVTFNSRHLHFGSIYLPAYQENYEPEVSAVLSVLLTGDKVFFDIGSNWGYFSFFAASKPAYRGPIYAFEPTPSTFNDLTDLVKQAGLVKRIDCVPVALSDESGHGYLEVDSFSSGLNKLTLSSDTEGFNEKIKIPIMPLDDFEKAAPDVLKIDAENHELNVLTGGTETLKKYSPFIIIENWYSSKTAETSLRPLQFLSSMDYILFYPIWQIDNQLVRFDNHADAKLASSCSKNILFSSFEAADRPKLPDQVNVFAVHASQIKTFLGSIPGLK